MERKVLVNEIIHFCLKYGILKYPVTARKFKNIERELANAEFVEGLINTIILKARIHKNTDINKLKELLLELERLRLELEYKDSDEADVI